MGLAGTRNKRKWAKDPNNTAWSRNTETFGQKILRSQGWAPGQYLGAQDASHSEFYTAANASHVRAVLKDDNMGLGARRNQGDECTGLDALQELLGRLNGRSEEDLGAERKKREGVRVSRYLERKLGTVRFVYGGLLVGDKVQALADELKKKKEEKAAAGEGQKDSKSKKRKAEDEGQKDSKSKKRKAEDEGESVSKKEKKSKKRRSEDEDAESKTKRKEKKDKKRKEKEASIQGGSESQTAEVPKPGEDDEDSSTQKKSKKDKKERRKKDKHQEDAAAGDPSDSQSKKKKKRRADKDDEADSSKPTPSTTQTPTPAASGTSTPVSEVPHRHLARRRFIAQKRAAVMDPAALNQIFMVKA